MSARFVLRHAKESAGTTPLPNLCIGTWAWGDSRTWNNASPKAREELDGAWACMQKTGLFFLDTAESYGGGESERIIRSLRDSSPEEFKAKLVIASKFIPVPWPPVRAFMPRGMVKYCKLSLERLGMEQMDLYQIHGPVHFLNSIDSMAQGLAECVELGLTKSVGVSNYSLEEMITMDEALKKRGLRLASNQVEFSLLRTLPEKSGLLAECKKRGILMMAYSPLGMGRLSGKYSAENPPPSGRRFSNYPMIEISPLLEIMRKVADAHNVKPSAVALKWVIQKGAIPLGGVKNAAQAEENAGSADEGWTISDDEMAELEKHTIVGTTSMTWQHG